MSSEEAREAHVASLMGPSAPSNSRQTSRWIEFRGETLSLAQWAARLGIRSDTIWQRLAYGWSVERAFLTPVRGRSMVA